MNRLKSVISIIFILLLLNAVLVYRMAKRQVALEKYQAILEKYIDTVHRYIKASNYEYDAMLYLMNTEYGNSEVHKMLADSCRIKCIKYKSQKDEYSK